MRRVVSLPLRLLSFVSSDYFSPVAGAAEKIASLRNRNRQIAESIALYEDRVRKQQIRLDKVNKGSDFGLQSQDEDEDDEDHAGAGSSEVPVTAQDLQREEEEIKELELKKRTLEERVAGMEKDLGGLLR